MNSTRIVILATLVLALSAAACGRKQAPPATPAAPPPAAAAVPAPPPPPPAPAAAPVPGDPLSGADLDAINEYVRRQGLLVTVYFDYDQAQLHDDTRERLARNARFLQERPEFIVAVEGHCDERGTAEYNLGLGERRAGAVTQYLGSLGVERGRLQPVSYGREHPACLEAHEACWRQNRRAQFVIVGRR